MVSHLAAALRLVWALAFLQMFSGCATDLSRNTEVAIGPSAEFDSTKLTASTDAQTIILTSLQRRAGLKGTPINTSDWDKILDSGMEYADERCEAYMAALFRLNRDKKTVNSQIGLVGTATAGVMAAAKSAARDIALAAITFGLASSTVDNLSSNLLYDLDPSSVRTLVRALQQKYRDNVGKGYVTRPTVLRAIRNYAVLCVPANIEAEVNLAVKQADPGATQGNGPEGKPPEVSNSTVTVDSSFLWDSNSSLLNDFIRNNGALDQTKLGILKATMKTAKVPDGISHVSFLNARKFEKQRADAVAILKLTQ